VPGSRLATYRVRYDFRFRGRATIEESAAKVVSDPTVLACAAKVVSDPTVLACTDAAPIIQ